MLHTPAPPKDLNSDGKLREKRDDGHTTSEYAIIIPPPLPSTADLRHLIAEQKTETSSGPLVTSGECGKALSPEPNRTRPGLPPAQPWGLPQETLGPPPNTARPPAS